MVRRHLRGISLLEVMLVAVAITTLSVAGVGTVRTVANHGKVTAAKATLAKMRTGVQLFKHRKGYFPATWEIGWYTYTARGDQSVSSYIFSDWTWIPPDPFKRSVDLTAGTVPTGIGGWLYDQATGRIWINLLNTEFGPGGSVAKLSEYPSTW